MMTLDSGDMARGKITALPDADPSALDMHAMHGGNGVVTTVGGNFFFINGPYKGAIYTRTLGADE